MNKYCSELISKLRPYIAGEQPQDQQYIKLNTNENPYPPSPAVLDAMRAKLDADLRLYPDPNATELKRSLASYCRVNSSNVFVGNGSDEVLALAFMAFFKKNKPVLFPDISYSFYPVYCGLFEIDFKLIPLTDTFEIDITAYAQANGGVIFPNPNAPTGRALSAEQVQQLLQKNSDSVVIIDEAYIDFGGESALQWIDQYPNLLVVQTFSKSRSLAGIRVGYALGHVGLIDALERVKNSFNSYPLDRLAIAGAVAAIQDEPYFQVNRKRIINTREQIASQLNSMGFRVLPSAANFLFVKHHHYPSEKLYLELKERGILIRYFDQPRIRDYVRITIGTDAEMNKLTKVLSTILTVTF
ncbi:MAG: histidinol-phosphate transaminase [Gammaproteobacteria bacterium]|nr:histidinol-phosphate transaminase [Gammaproteobacteria bacterium]